MTKHTLLTREESLRASDLISARLGPNRHLKISTVALTKVPTKEPSPATPQPG